MKRGINFRWNDARGTRAAMGPRGKVKSPERHRTTPNALNPKELSHQSGRKQGGEGDALGKERKGGGLAAPHISAQAGNPSVDGAPRKNRKKGHGSPFPKGKGLILRGRCTSGFGEMAFWGVGMRGKGGRSRLLEQGGFS